MKAMRYSIFCAFLVCVLGVGSALAQGTGGTIRGTVSDQQGLAMAGAKVTITNTQTNVAITLETSADGTYNYPDLIVGTYSVTVEKEGFQKFVRPGIQIFANQVTQVDIPMSVGAVTATVEVTAGTPLVQTATSQLSSSFDASQVADLPNPSLNGSPLNLAMLAPGTTPQGGGNSGEGGSVGGTRPRFNGFTIDGVDDNRLDVNGHSQDVIQDSVAEFNLLTNQFSAEYGHSAGGQFNIITKTGTNAWHGGGWLYNRNRNYNAMTNLEKGSGQTAPDRFDYNRFGGQIGGPIIHDKLFIYGAYQRQIEGLATRGVGQFAPTAAGLATMTSVADSAVQDILSQFPTSSTQAMTCGATKDQPCEEAITVPGTICDAAGPAPECTIPLGLISPTAPNYQNIDDFIINGDLTQGRHQIAVHVLYDRNRTPNPNLVTPLPQFTGDYPVDQRKYLVKDTWTATSNFINEFRMAYSRFSLATTVPATFANYPNAEIDTAGLDVGPEDNSPQSNVINTYQFVDQMSYVRGTHVFKWGAQWMHWIAPSNFLARSRGEWDYKNFNELVNDFVPTGSNGALRGAGSGFFAGNQNGIYWFVQDDWKVTPRLTLNLGLRYEWNGIPRDDKLQNLNAIATLPGVFDFRTPTSDKNNWAPRIGFAYDPLGDGKWAVRGGFGIAYDVTPQNFPLLSLPPQLYTEQNPGITCGLPGPPAWCASYLDPADGTGKGFLQGGGLLQTNVPCDTQLLCRQSTASFIVDVVEPKVLTWSLGVQHELGWNSSLEARYVGTRSLELPVQSRLNIQTGFDAGLAAMPTYVNASDVPATVTSPATTLGEWETFQNNAFTDCPTTAVNPTIYGSEGFCGTLVTAFPPLGSGTYHGVSFDFKHRVGHGLSLFANYTFSKNTDNSTNDLFTSRVQPRRPQDWQNMGAEHGLSALDQTHKLAVSWVYDLPNSHADSAFVRGVADGWRFSGSWLVMSGPPVTIQNGSDANGDFDSAGDRPIVNPNGTAQAGTQVDFVCNDGVGGATRIVAASDVDADGFANCGPLVGPPTDLHHTDLNVVGYVAQDPTAKYVTAGLGARSTLGRNSFRSPGLQTWGMSFAKTTKVNERVSVQFRADFDNIFNHRNFALSQPTALYDTNNQGQAYSQNYANIQSTGLGFLDSKQFDGGSRTMQLVLKLLF
jgi:outer membrane receptor protein involved in Fe transport